MLVERMLAPWVVYAQCLLYACCSVPLMWCCRACSMSCVFADVAYCDVFCRQSSAWLAHLSIIWVTFTGWYNKSSAVAEMGDRLATIDMGWKVGRAAVGALGHRLTHCGLGRGLPIYQVASWSIQPFGHSCRNATLLHLGIPLRTIFMRSLVVTHQNIYSTRALSYCLIPNKIK